MPIPPDALRSVTQGNSAPLGATPGPEGYDRGAAGAPGHNSAPSLSGQTYRAAARSVVVLLGEIGRGDFLVSS
jgi:hypothetical protein